MLSNTSMYGVNPYANPYALGYSNGLGNDDFLSNAYFGQQSYGNPYAQQQALMQAYQQPTQDTFQTQQEASNGSSALKFIGAGAVAGGAGAYFFGDKFGTNFVKEGKFSDDILKSFDKEVAETAKVSDAEIAKVLKKNGLTPKQYEALTKFLNANAIEQAELLGDKEFVKKLPKDLAKNGDKYGNAIIKSRADIKVLQENALKTARQGHLGYQLEELATLGKRKGLIEGLAKDATPAQLKELIIKNPKAFGITAETEAEIAKEADKIISKKIKTPADLIKVVDKEIASTQKTVDALRTTRNAEVTAKYWDKATNSFKTGAPKELVSAAKNFKWVKAGKFALIGAGIGLAANWLFGGKK